MEDSVRSEMNQTWRRGNLHSLAVLRRGQSGTITYLNDFAPNGCNNVCDGIGGLTFLLQCVPLVTDKPSGGR